MQNYIQEGEVLEVTVNSPAVPTAGVPCRFGSLCGVATLAEGEGGVSAATKTMVDFGGGVYDLSVTDTATGGIAIGDQIWFHDANPPLLNNVAASGYSFGIALEVVLTGATTTINVLHIPRHGLGTTPADTTVTTAKLVADNVTAAKLTATLRKGYHNLDITTCRLLSTNAIANTIEAYVPDGNTSPILARINGATDKRLCLTWASSGMDEIAFAPWAYPPDLDETAVVEVHVLALHGGATDHPGLVIGYFEGTGDTNAGGTTDHVTAAEGDVKVDIAAADIGAHPKSACITLTPGAHTVDTLVVYAVWVEYTRV